MVCFQIDVILFLGIYNRYLCEMIMRKVICNLWENAAQMMQSAVHATEWASILHYANGILRHRTSAFLYLEIFSISPLHFISYRCIWEMIDIFTANRYEDMKRLKCCFSMHIQSIYSIHQMNQYGRMPEKFLFCSSALKKSM